MTPPEAEQVNANVQKQLGGISLDKFQNVSKFFTAGILRINHVATLKAGQMFGELGLLHQKPRMATIVCVEDTDFAILTSEQFKLLLLSVEKKKNWQREQFFIQHLFYGCRYCRLPEGRRREADLLLPEDQSQEGARALQDGRRNQARLLHQKGRSSSRVMF